MKFDIINYSNEVIGRVEADDAVEAWSKAGNEFGNILDVRQVMALLEYHSNITLLMLKPFSELEPDSYNIIYKDEIIGDLVTKIVGDSLVVINLTVYEPGVVSKGFLSLLSNELERIAKDKNLWTVKVEYLLEHKRMYELVGFTQSYEEGEAGLVVKYIE